VDGTKHIFSAVEVADRVGEPLGIAYSMTDVGEPMDRKNTTRCMHYMLQLLQSLEALHAAGYCHGDAHVENAVIVNGRVKWVDFMTAMSDVNATDMSRRNDMRKLLESVYGDTILENTAVQLAIGNYPTPGTAQNICDSLPIAQTHT
jgi:tRNA A-37 threonylcarbamoyl transferase component Bud32